MNMVKFGNESLDNDNLSENIKHQRKHQTTTEEWISEHRAQQLLLSSVR